MYNLQIGGFFRGATSQDTTAYNRDKKIRLGGINDGFERTN